MGPSIFRFTAHVVYCRWEQGLEQLSNPIDPGHDVHDLEDFKPPRGKARPRPKAALADGPVEEDAKGDDDRDDDGPSAEKLLREEAEPTDTDLFEQYLTDIIEADAKDGDEARALREERKRADGVITRGVRIAGSTRCNSRSDGIAISVA